MIKKSLNEDGLVYKALESIIKKEAQNGHQNQPASPEERMAKMGEAKTSLAAPAGRGRAEPQRKGRGAKPQSEDDLWEQLDNHSWKEVRDDEQADQLSRSKLSPDERKALEEREALEAREYHEAYQKSFEWSQQDVETLRQAINALKSLSQKISNDDYPFNENSFHIMIGNLGGLLSTKAGILSWAAETSGSPRNPTAKGKVMTTKTASGYNHPAIPGRFFQKKAELQQALKVAWDYQSLTPEQQKLMGPKAPHEMSLVKQEMNELALEIDEVKARAMNELRGERQGFVNEFLELWNALQAQLRNGGTNTEEVQDVFEALDKKMNALRVSNDFRVQFNHILESYWGIAKRLMKKDESLAYASSKPGKKVAFTGAWSGLDWRALSTEEMVALSKFPFLQKMFEDDKEYVEFMETVGRAANPAERVRKEIPDEELEAEELLREHHSFGKPQGRKSTEPRYGPEHFPPYTADGQSPRPHPSFLTGADFDDAYVAD